uniref:Uncharacterized protein n=1 Tax=Caenorhabditis japonica TaxID=281687 RepID=A0A8R1IYZ8_CAEJA
MIHCASTLDYYSLATFRGGDSYVLLGDDDMQKLHKLAAQQGSESDTLAVQYLLANYKQVSEAPVDNWYASWLEKYEVTKPATYKSIEPLYVITPPSTLNPRHHDAIYSTPYSGSPLPFPPPPGTTVPHTPNSTYRYRVDTNKKAPKDFEGSMGQLPIDEPRIGHHPIYSPAMDPTYGTIPRARLAPNGAPPLSPTYSSGNDPHFLDPRRKQEVQTREELIY